MQVEEDEQDAGGSATGDMVEKESFSERTHSSIICAAFAPMFADTTSDPARPVLVE